MIDYWNELGRYKKSFDIIPLDYQDIRAYRDIAGIELDNTDAQLLIMMSSAYVAECRIATKPNAKPPYVKDDIKIVASPTLKDFFMSKSV